MVPFKTILTGAVVLLRRARRRQQCEESDWNCGPGAQAAPAATPKQ